MREFSIINSAAHRHPAIVMRAREEVPPDDEALFVVQSAGDWSHARVLTYTAKQRARLAARIKELIDGQT